MLPEQTLVEIVAQKGTKVTRKEIRYSEIPDYVDKCRKKKFSHRIYQKGFYVSPLNKETT